VQKKSKRGNQEGSICQRKDGRWQGAITIGRDPLTGRLKRAYVYGATREEVAPRLAEMLADRSRGVFTEPSKLTVGQWLQTWLDEIAGPSIRPLTRTFYETAIRRHLVGLAQIRLTDLKPIDIQRHYNRLSPGAAHKAHVTLRTALRRGADGRDRSQSLRGRDATPARAPGDPAVDAR
jgi:integrase